jgi:hypothetical protein
VLVPSFLHRLKHNDAAARALGGRSGKGAGGWAQAVPGAYTDYTGATGDGTRRAAASLAERVKFARELGDRVALATSLEAMAALAAATGKKHSTHCGSRARRQPSVTR